MIRKILFVLTAALCLSSCEKQTGSGDGGEVIFIHSSYGGYKHFDKHAYDGVTNEKDVTLAFCAELKSHLEERGYEVILNQSELNMLTYDEVKNQAPGKKIKALLQINAGWSSDSKRERISGLKIFYGHLAPPSRHLDSLISQSIHIHANIMAQNLGMRSALILQMPDIPGIRIELGNINNKDDLAKMLSTEYRQSIVEAIAYGLDDFIKYYE